MMTTRVPKAKVIRMHKLLDEALGVWQESVRDYYLSQWNWGKEYEPAGKLEEDLLSMVASMRELRAEMEAEEAKP